VAALLAPDPATTVILLVAGIFTVLLAISREKRTKKLADELADLLALHPHHTSGSISLERNLLAVQRRLFVLVAIVEMSILIAVLLANLDVTTARNYALLALVSLSPLGLEIELAALMRLKRTRSSETVRTAIGYALEDAYILLAILACSLVGSLWLHIPPALSVLQILIITCVSRLLLSGRTLQATPHKNERFWRILFAAVTIYGSYVFFFIRHYLDPAYADIVNPVTWQATTVAMLTFIACQAILPLFNPKAPRVASYRLAILVVVILLVSYVPTLQSYVMTAGPDAADWVWILIGGLFFASLVLVRQYLAEHDRAASVV